MAARVTALVPGLTLVTGGARAGKSAWVLREVGAGPATFIATAEALDEDMAARIARHRAERPAHWHTVEEPLDLPGAVRRADGEVPLVVDCLTLWVSNLLLRAGQEGQGHAWSPQVAATDLIDALAARAAPSLVVSNEVGSGVVPPTPIGRSFQDALGSVNQLVAHRAGRVVLMVAGLPVRIR
jgi:adenosylcobinamide kinase/adenosylcobinamide-phosphate guanylyltransferase